MKNDYLSLCVMPFLLNWIGKQIFGGRKQGVPRSNFRIQPEKRNPRSFRITLFRLFEEIAKQRANISIFEKKYCARLKYNEINRVYQTPNFKNGFKILRVVSSLEYDMNLDEDRLFIGEFFETLCPSSHFLILNYWRIAMEMYFLMSLTLLQSSIFRNIICLFICVFLLSNILECPLV